VVFTGVSIAVSFSGLGRSLRSHWTMPNVTPAHRNTATTTDWRKKRHGNLRAASTAGSYMVLGVLLSRRQSGGLISAQAFRAGA
jgi:hypothetical protein